MIYFITLVKNRGTYWGLIYEKRPPKMLLLIQVIVYTGSYQNALFILI